MDSGAGPFELLFGLFWIFWIAIMVLAVGAMVFWILKIIEVARIPDYQYRTAGTDKVTWVLVVALAGAIGALVWQFAKRAQVLDAAGLMPAAVPGWYPEPGTQHLRWWDGGRWTEHNHPLP